MDQLDVATRIVAPVMQHLAPLALRAIGESVTKAKTRETASKLFKTIHQRVYSRMKVKTLVFPQAAQDLARFYWQPTLQSETGGVRARYLRDFLPGWGTHVVVRGPAGQGKSIYALHLSLMELTSGERIPLLIELRRFTQDADLIQLLLNELVSLGFEKPTAEVAKELISDSRVSLILDGFDEVPPASRLELQQQIASLAELGSRAWIVITSRPYTEAEMLPDFTVVDLAPIGQDEQPEFLKKLVPRDSEELTRLLQVGSLRSLSSLLSTPLLLSLMVIHYRRHGGGYETLAKFFGDLFDVFLDRHDRSKSGYQRWKASDLTTGQLREVFNAFSLIAKKNDYRGSVPRNLAQPLMTKAIETVGIHGAKVDDVVRDLVQVGGLLLPDDGGLAFVHESIRAYHAAECISRDERVKESFYRKAGVIWEAWEDELFFLGELDRYHFSKMFLIPHATEKLPGVMRATGVGCTNALLQEVFCDDYIEGSSQPKWSFRSQGTRSFIFRPLRRSIEDALHRYLPSHRGLAVQMIGLTDPGSVALTAAMRQAVASTKQRMIEAQGFVRQKDLSLADLNFS